MIRHVIRESHDVPGAAETDRPIGAVRHTAALHRLVFAGPAYRIAIGDGALEHLAELVATAGRPTR
ncbi:hypothetical protein E1211_31600 [Micromonospora sp. 15K316]|uniref:hypothetical protein n=1 Tax=Micromonospora sp. 15K316 TaxID=2530376 RepID=UPI001048F2DC|nr:hypothetical protein [Micromonospora sp. 15K316]TDC22167.1 hypothetical protein E1211_31600 [Micromonospora sp. 15K316]